IFLRDGEISNIGDIETIVQAYTQVVAEDNQTEVFFLPREDSAVNFTRFSMQGSSGKLKRVFTAGEDFYFVVDYEVKEPILGDYFALLIYRTDGLLILKAAEDDYGRKVLEGKKPGKYKVKIRFPGNVLNEGIYKFRVVFGKRRGVFHEDRHGFSFEIEDWNDYTNSSFGKRNGVLLLPLGWSEEKID
ncbi:MAG TPA: Wzt carbohydrate-binding domain-containing protein, partial [Anaerolineales bacterium]|nr:Wzt carbohydrate-binding domain-containing protein [Anaerolineales bacterium]